MALMNELGSLIEGWGYGTTTGTLPSIQYGRPQSTPDNVIVIIPGLGRRAEKVMGVGRAAVVYHQPSVQIYVRRAKYMAAECETLAWQIHNSFDQFQGTVLGVRYFLIECQQPPYSMSVDENMRPIFLFNMHIRREPVE